ncbi:MAG: hypothetical protein IK123_03760, partial [Lachnospiraceae bacterium]|nr:hypothetical protein [Lachnospiraceae bacterium]
MNISKPILLCVLTARAIIWTGIGYIKWFYGLFDCYSAGFLDISASVVDYALQGVGVLIFILYIRRHTSGLRNAMYFVITGELVFMIAATVVSIVPLKLILGYV